MGPNSHSRQTYGCSPRFIQICDGARIKSLESYPRQDYASSSAASRTGDRSIDWMEKKAMDDSNGDMKILKMLLIVNDENVKVKIVLTLLMKNNCVI